MTELCKIILKPIFKCRSCSSDKLHSLQFYLLTFKCNLDLGPFWTNGLNDTFTDECEHLLVWNSYVNVEVVAWTTYNHHNFIIWPSYVTLTLHLSGQMLQIGLLLIKVNTFVKWILNPYQNVEVVALISSIHHDFIIRPSSVTLTMYQSVQMLQMIKENTCEKMILKSVCQCRSWSSDKPCSLQLHHLTFKFTSSDLQVWPWPWIHLIFWLYLMRLDSFNFVQRIFLGRWGKSQPTRPMWAFFPVWNGVLPLRWGKTPNEMGNKIADFAPVVIFRHFYIYVPWKGKALSVNIDHSSMSFMW